MSDTLFQSIERPRLSEEVARQIERAIREGRFLPGERLPSERELTARFGISRPILREALRILEIHGLIGVRHGRGAFVRDLATESLHVPATRWLSENIDLVYQFFEACLIIEPECAALASQRASHEEIVGLKKLADQLLGMAQEQKVGTFVGLDIDFHSAIARMSGNVLLFQMLDSLLRPGTDVLKSVFQLPQQLSLTCQGQRRVVAAIQDGDSIAARQAMLDMLRAPLDQVGHIVKEQEEVA